MKRITLILSALLHLVLSLPLLTASAKTETNLRDVEVKYNVDHLAGGEVCCGSHA